MKILFLSTIMISVNSQIASIVSSPSLFFYSNIFAFTDTPIITQNPPIATRKQKGYTEITNRVPYLPSLLL